MPFETLITAVDGPIGILTLNRPDKLNALSPLVLRELAAAARWFDEQPDVRVVILQGEGRAFSAGADLDEPMSAVMGESTAPTDWIARRERGQLGFRMAEAIEQMRAVTIAQVHGYAVGGGIVLMAACDMRVVAEDTVLFIPEVDLGIPLAWGGIPRLVREMGPALTKELVMTCRRFTPAEGQAAGFINRVVPATQVAAEATELAHSLVAKPSIPLLITKEHVNTAAREMASNGNANADGDTLLSVLNDPAGAAARTAYVQKTLQRR